MCIRDSQNGTLAIVVANTFFDQKQVIHSLSEVIVGVNYVMIISTSAGLWRYNIGDTIKFTNKYPFRVIVSGRIKHFISAFGEHVIAKEVETTIREVSLKLKLGRDGCFFVKDKISIKSCL